MNNMIPNFTARRLPTSGVGVDVSMFHDADTALRLGGVTWGVETSPVYDEYGVPDRTYRFIRRDDTHQVFGVVKDGYKPIQPSAAFTLTQGLLDAGCRLDKLGAYHGGELVWMNLTMPERTILGEPFSPNIFILAGNNGKQALTVKFSLVRAWCCNMLSLVTANQFFNVNISHKGNIEGKFNEAYMILSQAAKYWEEIEGKFISLRGLNLERKDVISMIETLLPTPKGKSVDELTDRSREELQGKRNRLWLIWKNAPDLQNESENGYRFLNAVADYETHLIPSRKTDGWRERNLLHMVNERSMVDAAYKLMVA